MGLTQMQAAMARLYTDAALRERFFADPPAGGEALGLSTDEALQLAQLSPRQVNFFARSLHHKRLVAICKLMPLTHRALAHRFAELFRRYVGADVPGGMKRHRDDALAFAALIERVASADGIAQWIVEVARYESAWLKMADPTRRCAVCVFWYPIGTLPRAWSPAVELPSPLALPTLAMWYRLSRRGRLRHLVVSLPCRQLRSSDHRILQQSR